MARYTGPKNRVARRFGVNIFGRARNPLVHKSHPAGMHGMKRKKKSDFGVQLEEKQKLKAVFGMITEKQLLNYFQEASSKHLNTPEVFLQMLECRLDVAVWRLKFAPTIFAAQQLVSHGHIMVNGKRVDRRSFRVKPGMAVSVKESARKMKIVEESVVSGSRTVPSYYETSENGFAGKLLALPSMADISLPLDINIPMICDFVAHRA